MALYDSLQATSEMLRKRAGGRKPRVALVLGSGLGAFADQLEDAVRVPYEEIPGFPTSTVQGHAGQLVIGRAPGSDLEVAAMQGRVHCYEGHAVADVVYPIRALVTLGAGTILLTNAAGGCDPTMSGGELVLVKDHLNLTGRNPLEGQNDERVGPRFPDLTHTYDAELRRIAEGAAQKTLGRPLREGVYAWLLGPSYETPAEIRMVRTLGADLVGMSTAPEAIAAVHMGARVMAISCVTNLAAGISEGPLSHGEVMETAARVRTRFLGLISAILVALEAGVSEVDTAALEAEAQRIRLSAYAPYSGYRVGAALRTRSGRVFAGANVENASYGLTVCAERVAVMQAALAGERELEALAVATQSSPPAAPCGACRQVLREFAKDLLVVCTNDRGERRELRLAALLPEGFAPDTAAADLPGAAGGKR